MIKQKNNPVATTLHNAEHVFSGISQMRRPEHH